MSNASSSGHVGVHKLSPPVGKKFISCCPPDPDGLVVSTVETLWVQVGFTCYAYGERMVLTPKATVGARFIHPRADPGVLDGGEHDWALDVASEANRNYLRWIADSCAPFLGDRVLEVGAGFGAVTQHFAPGRDLVAVDLSEACCDALRLRFAESANVTVVQGDLRDLDTDQRFDSVVMINVLEHIYDDSGVLRALSDRLLPGGSVVLYVPALNGLYGNWDRKVGHFRRYSKRRLRAVVEEAGLRVSSMTYMNALAIPGWVLFSRLMRFDETGGSTFSLWDRTGAPLSRILESRLRAPIGLNLLCVATSAGERAP
jgi:2-polyprenyl-3-methyl-5-hydroxy-6-metoxy-1,4-benzoquinol methylase